MAADISRNQYALKLSPNAIFNCYSFLQICILNLMYFRRTCLDVHETTKPGHFKHDSVRAVDWSTGEFEVNSLHSDSIGDTELPSEVCGFEFVSGDRIS